jgi:hypothetical protein
MNEATDPKDMDVRWELEEIVIKKDLDDLMWFYSGYTPEQFGLIEDFYNGWAEAFGGEAATDEEVCDYIGDVLTYGPRYPRYSGDRDSENFEYYIDKGLDKLSQKMDFFEGIFKSREHTMGVLHDNYELLVGYLEVAYPKATRQQIEGAIKIFEDEWGKGG